MRKKSVLWIFLIFFIIFLILLIIIFFLNTGSITSNVVMEPYSEIEVYFCPEGMCKEKIIGLINSSSDIKCAFYDLDLPDMIDLLREKKAQVVIEDSNKIQGFYTGYSNALMHNKFCIFDNSVISTGSMNPTENDNYRNNNNLIIIKSKALAENYLAEFNELKNNIYGKGDKVKNKLVYLGEVKIENYFCPEDNCKQHVINALKQANKSIYFMTFSFTDEDIGNLVWNKQYLGVEVKGIFDREQISDYSRYEDLKDFSIIDKNKYKLHHKVFIIDNQTVITGSFNPSQNANERNDENIIIIHDRDITKKYIDEFNKLFYHEEKLPENTAELAISKILYDAVGRDEGNEIIELKNIGEEELILDYYSFGDNKTTMKLNGTIKTAETISFSPTFALKNTGGMLILKHNAQIIDFVAWEGAWALKTTEGQFLKRKDFFKIEEAAWGIN